MVKPSCPALTAVRVWGSRSNPPEATLLVRPYLASAPPSTAVEPPSTAKTPWSWCPFDWMKFGMFCASWLCDAWLSKPDCSRTFIPAALSAALAPSRRGWMLSEPGWAMMPQAVPPLGICEARRLPTSWPDVYSACPTYARPLVGSLTEPLAL